MRSNPHLRRCLHGRNGKMVHRGAAEEDSTTLVVEEEEVVDEVVMTSSRAAAEVMTEEVVAAEEGEETTVGVKLRGTGRTALAEVDTRVITRMVDIEAVMEEEELASMEASRGRDTKEEATKEASKDRGTQEEATKAEVRVSSMRATIRTEVDTRREVEGVVVGVEGGEEAAEEEEVEVGREEDGVEEEGRILTKAGSLSSSFSKVGNSITRLALDREDSLLAEKRRLLRSTASKGTHNSVRVGD